MPQDYVDEETGRMNKDAREQLLRKRYKEEKRGPNDHEVRRSGRTRAQGTGLPRLRACVRVCLCLRVRLLCGSFPFGFKI